MVRDRLEVIHQGPHRALTLGGDRQRPLGPGAPIEQAANHPGGALTDQPDRQSDEPDQNVEDLRGAVQGAVLALRRGQPLPHTYLGSRPPQIVSTTHPLALSKSASEAGISSKIQPESSC